MYLFQERRFLQDIRYLKMIYNEYNNPIIIQIFAKVSPVGYSLVKSPQTTKKRGTGDILLSLETSLELSSISSSHEDD